MAGLRSPAEDLGSIPANIQDQSEDHNKLAGEVFKKYWESKEYRKAYDKDWHRFYQYWAGYQWPLSRPDWMSTPVINYCFAIISTAAAIMTDSTPNIDINPVHPENADKAGVLKQVLKREWTKSRMQVELYKIVTDLLIYGTSFAKVVFNKQKKCVDVLPVPPYFVYPAPGSINVEDAEYVIFAQPMPIAKVMAMYPKNKIKITGGAWDQNVDFVKNITSVKGDLKQAAIMIEGQEPGLNFLQPGKGQMDKKGQCTYVEYWHRDPENWENTRVCVVANGVVLANQENHYKHGKFPFVRFVDYPVSTVFWGIGEIHQTEKIQDSVNQRRGHIQDILRLCASPPFVYSKDAGLNPHAYPNIPGIKIPINPGSTFQWMPTPQVNEGLFRIQQLDKVDFDIITGLGEISQGRRPKGVTAASAIIALQEAAMTRMRPKIRFMEESLTEIGELMVSTIQQYYTDEMLLRVSGNGKTDWLKVNEQMPSGEVNNDLSVGEFEVDIGVGSDLGIDKGLTFEMMKELKALIPDVVDPRSLLEAMPGLSQEKVEEMLKKYEDAVEEQKAAEGAPAEEAAAPAAPEAGGLRGLPPEAAGASPDEVEGMGLPSEEEIIALESEFGA